MTARKNGGSQTPEFLNVFKETQEWYFKNKKNVSDQQYRNFLHERTGSTDQRKFKNHYEASIDRFEKDAKRISLGRSGFHSMD